MKLKMEIRPNSEDEVEGFRFCWGKIFIGDDFWESITPALNYWTKADYEQQWKEGLERIKTHDTSCLVASVQNPQTSNPLIDWWVLYKVGDTIFIQNELIVAEDYERLIGNNIFSRETCYNFIQPRETASPEGLKYSEWSIDA